MRLYLASTSPARLATLRAAGIEPVVVPSEVDEDAVAAAVERESGPLSPAAYVQLLARAKAEAITGSLVGGQPIDGLVLGGDSAFELDGIVYGKPHRPEVARERWLRQRGRSGRLHSGHWLIDRRGGASATDPSPAAGAASSAVVHFAPDIADAEIDAYIATGEPLRVAGAFTIDGLGGAFVTGVEGDPHTVVGLSVPLLRTLTGQLGVPWTSLWNRDRSTP